jgi:quinol monooxygenase YgiN
MYLLRLKVRIQDEKRTEFEKSMHDLMKEQVKYAGIHPCLYRSTDDNQVFYYQEEWNSRKKLNKHILSDHFRALLGCLKALGILEQSEILHAGEKEELL